MSINQENSDYAPNQQSPNPFKSVPKRVLNNINTFGGSWQNKRDFANRTIVTNFDNQNFSIQKLEMLSPQIKPNLNNDLLNIQNKQGTQLKKDSSAAFKFQRMQTSQQFNNQGHKYINDDNYGIQNMRNATKSAFNESEQGISDNEDKLQIQRLATNEHSIVNLGDTLNIKQFDHAPSLSNERTPKPGLKGFSPVITDRKQMQFGKPKLNIGTQNQHQQQQQYQLQTLGTGSDFRFKSANQNNQDSTSNKQSQDGSSSLIKSSQPNIPQKLINATRDLILYGNSNNNVNATKNTLNNLSSQRRQSRRASFLRMRNNPYMGSNISELANRLQSKVATTNNDQTNENILPTIPSVSVIQYQPDVSVLGSDINVDNTRVTFFGEETRRRDMQMLGSQRGYAGGLGQNQDMFQVIHQKLDDKINWQIMNLDVEGMNRNTRFFKDYLKDQIKEQKKKSRKKMPDLKEIAGNLFQKQDSLTKGIQAESSAPLRRLTNRNLGEDKQQKNQSKKNQELLNRKIQNSINTLFGKKKDKNAEQSEVRSVKSNNRPSDISVNSSYEFSSSMEDTEGNIKKKIQRKKSIIQTAFAFLNFTKDDREDDEINEIQIRRINQGRMKQSLIIYPDSNLRSFIDGTSFMLMLIISVYIPFIISFGVDTSGPFDYFELFIDIWFMLEIFLNFFTGFYLKGILITDKQQIFMEYARGWFFIDILSSAPILIISLISQDSPSNYQAMRSTKLIRILRFARYARLLRLMKFMRLNKYLQPFEELIVSDWAHLGVRFLKISCAVVFITHWAACVLYSVAVNEFDMLGMNWLSLENLNDASITEQYINALYMAATTMCTVGYGDFHPTTSNERVISMIIMIVSSLMFSFIIGDISRTVSGFNLLADQYREKMVYVDKFLTQKSIPINLRLQVKRYLEYNLQIKRLYKIEEHDLLGLLNENLRGKITVYFNGRILQNVDVLNKFPIEFLSNLSIILRKRTFSIDENLIIEKTLSGELFYMQNGRVSAIHMKSKTHLVDLEKEKYFGEISFFTELPRQATIKARDFTEVLILTREDFLSMALKVENLNVLSLYHKIRESVIENPKDFRLLKIRCYICYTQGHIAIDCKQFHRFKGNLIRYFKKLYKKSINSDTDSNDEEKKKNPLTNTLESRDKKNSKMKRRSSKRRFSNTQYRKYTPQRTFSDTNFIESSRLELIDNTQSQNYHMSFLKDDTTTLRRRADGLNLINQTNFYDEIFDEQNVFNQQNDQLNQTPIFGFQQLSANIRKKSALDVKKRKSSLTPKATSQIDTDSIGDMNQIVHFDTPPKEDLEVDQTNFIQSISSSNNLKNSPFKKRKSRGIRDVIREELLEEDEVTSQRSSVSSTSSQIDEFSNTSSSETSSHSSNSSVSFLQRNLNEDNNDDIEEEKQPLLSQTTSRQRPGKPQSMNQLTLLVGNKKRFSSKQGRRSEKQVLRSSQDFKRKIHIRPLNEIHKEVKTVIKKTYTTTVETITQKEKYKITPQLNDKAKSKPTQQQQSQPSGLNQANQNNFNEQIQKYQQEFDQKMRKDLANVNSKNDLSISSSIKDLLDSSRSKQRKSNVHNREEQKYRDSVDLQISDNDNYSSPPKNINQDQKSTLNTQHNVNISPSYAIDKQNQPIQNSIKQSPPASRTPLNQTLLKNQKSPNYNYTSQQQQQQLNQQQQLQQESLSYKKVEESKEESFINDTAKKFQMFNLKNNTIVEQWDSKTYPPTDKLE